MKPIEIHIEGYKIVIEEDKQPEVTKEQEETIKYIPYPVVPTPNSDWWTHPFASWTSDDVIYSNKTTGKPFTPVRDMMVGKNENRPD